jgi:hypothetical protein
MGTITYKYSLDECYLFAKENNINLNNFTYDSIILYIDVYINYLEYNYKRNYKYKEDYLHCEIISQIYLNNPTFRYKYYIFTKLLVLRINCQTILKTIELHEFQTPNIIELIEITSEKGCWPTMQVLLKYIYIINKDLLDIDTRIICTKNSFINTDDRMYKNIVNLILQEKFISIDLLNTYDIKKQLIVNIFSSNRPVKYVLRRLKSLSSLLKLDYMIDVLIENASSYLNSNLINKIFLYYYKKFNILNQTSIIYLVDLFHDICIYEKLNTGWEKNMYFIEYEINNIIKKKERLNININLEVIHYDLLNNTQKEIMVEYLEKLINILIVYKTINIPLSIYKIFSLYNNDIINTIILKYNFYNNNIYNIIPYVKYFPTISVNYIKLNKCIYYLRVYIRNKNKINFINKKIKIIPLLNEMRNLKPSDSIKVFKTGTNFYTNKNQEFNKVPPMHILPGQIQYLFNSSNFLIREKADGILVNSIPLNIYPPIKFDCNIKAEYIESLNLYLVFDVDINLNIEERYLYLRQLHKFTSIYDNNNSKIEDIYNDINLVNSINLERSNMLKFLNETNDMNYRWYPKAAWKVNQNCDRNNIMVQTLDRFILNILNSKTDKFICSEGPIINDGIIISPLNGTRELKIKPKDYLSIDLLYKNNNWIDSDNIIYNNIIKLDNIYYTNNTIWRCYPIGKYYEAREIRFDKIKPNNSIVVNYVINLYNITHSDFYDSIYFTKNILSNNILSEIQKNEWNNICKINKNIITKLLNKLPCRNILDLGCGNSKILKIIKTYNFYQGIDYDVNILAKTISLHPINNKTIFNNVDLGKDWNQPDIMWNKIDLGQNYDTIIAINSIQHFNTDIFWTQLNKITTKGTHFLINILTIENNSNIIFNESYLKRVDDTIYLQFKPVHTKEFTEYYIEPNIYLQFEKYGWSIKTKYIEDTLLLPRYYTWFILIKN